MKKAVIIGAGIGGIATAIRLAAAGFNVSVLEQNSYPGGKLSSIEGKGYKFDAGPSLLTMPYLIDDLFLLKPKDSKAKFEYKPLEISCNYFFSDGTKLKAYADKNLLYQEFENQLGLPKKVLKKYLNKTKYIWQVTAPIFLKKSLHRFKTYFSLDTAWRALQLPFIGIHQKMNSFNQQRLKNANAIQYFNRFATYNGSNPYKAPATINVIAYLEHFEGAFYPLKSMISITESLVQLAEDLGVKFNYNTQCHEIVIENKVAKGVQTAKGFITGDIIISNCDIYNTYKYLLPKAAFPKHIQTQERSSSAYIFYWGINSTFDLLEVHNILFSSDYKKEFSAIWDDKNIPDEPTVYINISSKYNPKDAPEGCENWFVMINVPSNLQIDWEEKHQGIRKKVIEIINKQLHTDIESHIVYEDVLNPQGIEAKTGSYLGALYGSASNDKLAAFFRQSNQMKIAKNLYAVGGSVHPGGGVPLCLLGAEITSNLILKK